MSEIHIYFNTNTTFNIVARAPPTYVVREKKKTKFKKCCTLVCPVLLVKIWKSDSSDNYLTFLVKHERVHTRFSVVHGQVLVDLVVIIGYSQPFHTTSEDGSDRNTGYRNTQQLN